MIRKTILAATLVLALQPLPSAAIQSDMQMTGAAFSDACTRNHESWISFCNGYIQASVDKLRPEDKVCIPRGTTRSDIVTIVEKTITGSDQLKSLNAFNAVHLTLQLAYPCS